MHTSVKKMNRGQRKTTSQTRTGSKAEDGANNLFFFCFQAIAQIIVY
jgi:hypothetical protein